MKIAKEGYIIGGNCDKAHRARSKREDGARYFLNWMVRKNCFSCIRGWYRVVKELYPPRKQMYLLGVLHGGDFEIGIHRLQQEVINQLYKKQKSFRWEWIERWADGIAALEFGVEMDTPLSIISPGEKCKFGLCLPWRDDIYQARKARGDL